MNVLHRGPLETTSRPVVSVLTPLAPGSFYL